MKKGIFLSVCFILLAAMTFISCEKDEEFDDFCNNLDVNSVVTLTKSISGPPHETGATQSLGPQSSFKDIPKNEDECALSALFQVLLKKSEGHRINITFQTDNGTETKEINERYTVADAYRDVKDVLSTPNKYPICDENGDPIPEGTPGWGYYNYQGGDLPPSMLTNIGKQTGILSGNEIHFSSYDELYDFISNPEWANKHPSGTYIITVSYHYDDDFDIERYGIENRNIGSHAYVGKGTSSSNKHPEQIKLTSIESGTRTFYEENMVSNDNTVCNSIAKKNKDSVVCGYTLFY